MIINLGTKYIEDRVLKNNKEAISFTVTILIYYYITKYPKKFYSKPYGTYDLNNKKLPIITEDKYMK